MLILIREQLSDQCIQALIRLGPVGLVKLALTPSRLTVRQISPCWWIDAHPSGIKYHSRGAERNLVDPHHVWYVSLFLTSAEIHQTTRRISNALYKLLGLANEDQPHQQDQALTCHIYHPERAIFIGRFVHEW